MLENIWLTSALWLGLALFAVALGALYDRSILALVIGSVLLQAAALPVLLWLTRERRPAARA